MFKRVLLCHDGSDAGRRALKRGAELAILLRAHVHVLLVASPTEVDPVIVAGAAGHACILDSTQTSHEAILARSIQWLTDRGVRADGHLAHGNSIDQICEYAKRLEIDLIVLGHYPRPKGGFWWSGPQRMSLAERVNCCVLVAMDPQEGLRRRPRRRVEGLPHRLRIRRHLVLGSTPDFRLLAPRPLHVAEPSE